MKQNIIDWWTGYWFAPAPVLDLSIVRIVIVGAQLLLLLFYGSYDIERFEEFSELEHALYHPIPAFRIATIFFGLDFRPDFTFLLIIYWSTVLVGFMALVGIFTNISMGLFLFGNVFLIGFLYSFGDFHHTQAPLILCLVVLMLSPCGRVLTLDRQMSSTPSKDVVAETDMMAGWPIKLMQWVFALIYVSAFLEKMVFIGGLDWLNGFTLQYYMARDTLWRGSLMGDWMHRHHELILFQGTFWISLIFTRLKWIYVPLGFAFHVMIYVQLNAIFMEWMAVYVVFVPVTAFIMAYRRARSEGINFRLPGLGLNSPNRMAHALGARAGGSHVSVWHHPGFTRLGIV